ncbi:MAG TPA: LysM peptidoglycan-binding domain-containing protein, partial [Burkholderiaceae bacterium]
MLAAVLPLALHATPAVAAGEPMLEFKVVKRDTLSSLSRSVLVSPNAWREVARINRLRNPNVIRPGQVLRIPARLMRTVPVPATLVAVTGDVKVGDRPAEPNTPLVEGEMLQTGPNASAVIELADRSRVQMPPSSLAALAASRRVGARAVNAPPN